MNCPVCTTTSMVMTERQGIEIDYCPSCRGVWLDRGELDKIIERSAQQEVAAAPKQQQQSYQQPPPQQQYGHYADKYHYKQGHGYGHGHHYKKKKSFFEELFD